MTDKLTQLQQIYQQSRTEEEQKAIKMRRLKNFLSFFGAIVALSTVKYAFGSFSKDK